MGEAPSDRVDRPRTGARNRGRGNSPRGGQTQSRRTASWTGPARALFLGGLLTSSVGGARIRSAIVRVLCDGAAPLLQPIPARVANALAVAHRHAAHAASSQRHNAACTPTAATPSTTSTLSKATRRRWRLTTRLTSPNRGTRVILDTLDRYACRATHQGAGCSWTGAGGQSNHEVLGSSFAYARPKLLQAADGGRTRDLKLGKLALYQLSYRRARLGFYGRWGCRARSRRRARVSGDRRNQGHVRACGRDREERAPWS